MSTIGMVLTVILMILAVILAAIILTEGMARVKNGEPFFKKPGKFFIDNCDYVKLFGTLVLFIGFIACLNVIGFTVTSIVFVFLFNVLYAGVAPKSLLVSAIIALVSSIVIAVLFGVVFNITLPSGICTMAFPQFGFTLY